MNDTLTLCLEIVFWFALFVVFYTYLGYGIVLYILVKLKELFVKPVKRSLPPSDEELPEVTLFITAFNEEDVVDEKMENSLELDYPADKLHIVWVTFADSLGRKGDGALPAVATGKDRGDDARNDAYRHSARGLYGCQHDGEPGSGAGDCACFSESEGGLCGR